MATRRAVRTHRDWQPWHSPQVLAQELVGIAYLVGANRRLDAAAAPPGLLEVERRLLGVVRYVNAMAQGHYRSGEAGVRTPLRRMLDEARAAGHIECRLVCRGPLSGVAPSVARALLQVAQEAISNAVRHADCTRLEVRCEALRASVRLDVRDDGHGMQFDRPEAPGATGLSLMRMRAADCGAKLTIAAGSPTGTLVRFQARSRIAS